MAWREAEILDLGLLAARIAGGADVNKELERDWGATSYSMTYPLGTAAYHGNVEACRILLAAGADPSVGRQGLVSPLCLVIEGRNQKKKAGNIFSAETMRELMLLLCKAGASQNGPNDFGGAVRHDKSPLYYAVVHSDEEAVVCLAELGANLDMCIVSDSAGSLWTAPPAPALKSAAEKGKSSIVAALLRHGADDDCLRNTVRGTTALQECVIGGHAKAVEYYVRERGEDLAQRINGRTLLQAASSAEVRTILKALKTEFSVEKAIDVQMGPSKPVVATKKNRGMAL